MSSSEQLERGEGLKREVRSRFHQKFLSSFKFSAVDSILGGEIEGS